MEHFNVHVAPLKPRTCSESTNVPTWNVFLNWKIILDGCELIADIVLVAIIQIYEHKRPPIWAWKLTQGGP